MNRGPRRNPSSWSEHKHCLCAACSPGLGSPPSPAQAGAVVTVLPHPWELSCPQDFGITAVLPLLLLCVSRGWKWGQELPFCR